MPTPHEVDRAMSHVDPEHVTRCLGLALHLLRQEPRHRNTLTPHELVTLAHTQILEHLHDTDFHPNLLAFLQVVMTKIIVAARKQAV